MANQLTGDSKIAEREDKDEISPAELQEWREKIERQRLKRICDAAKEEGILEGEKIGREEGIQIGESRGFQKGAEETERKIKLKTLKNVKELIEKNWTTEQIIDAYYMFDEEEIDAVRTHLQNHSDCPIEQLAKFLK